MKQPSNSNISPWQKIFILWWLPVYINYSWMLHQIFIFISYKNSKQSYIPIVPRFQFKSRFRSQLKMVVLVVQTAGKETYHFAKIEKIPKLSVAFCANSEYWVKAESDVNSIRHPFTLLWFPAWSLAWAVSFGSSPPKRWTASSWQSQGRSGCRRWRGRNDGCVGERSHPNLSNKKRVSQRVLV